MTREGGGRRVGGVILAAGSSSRMGRVKQLLPYGGKPLLQHAVDLLGRAALAETVVVLGYAADEILPALTLPAGVRAVVNPEHASGQNASLRAGLAALGPTTQAALLLVGDQPGIHDGAIRAILEARIPEGKTALRTLYGDVPGHPVLLLREIWDELTRPGVDAGAREWLDRHPAAVGTIPTPGPLPIEVDTEEDYRRLLRTP